MQSKIKTLFNELNACAQNKIRRGHDQDTTDKIIQVINKRCKDTMVLFKPGLHHTSRR